MTLLGSDHPTRIFLRDLFGHLGFDLKLKNPSREVLSFHPTLSQEEFWDNIHQVSEVDRCLILMVNILFFTFNFSDFSKFENFNNIMYLKLKRIKAKTFLSSIIQL